MILGFDNAEDNVDFVNNGNRALELLQNAFDEKEPARYTLVLIECRLPIMDGFETIT